MKGKNILANVKTGITTSSDLEHLFFPIDSLSTYITKLHYHFHSVQKGHIADQSQIKAFSLVRQKATIYIINVYAVLKGQLAECPKRAHTYSPKRAANCKEKQARRLEEESSTYT